MSPLAPLANAVARWSPPGGPPIRRLVLFPHAGGGGLTGRALAADDVEVLVHRRPGREARMAEQPSVTVAETVDEALDVLLPILDGDALPTDVLGHSFGGLLAAEFVAALERQRPGRVRRLVISAKAPPPDRDPALSAALNDDAALVAWLSRLGGTPSELLADPALREMVLAPLRADLRVSLTHAQPPPRLRTPLLLVTADGDATAPPDSVAAWAAATAGPVERLELHGGHHALYEEAGLLHEALCGPGIPNPPAS